MLTNYGPVNRLWFDGDGFSPNMPAELAQNDTLLWEPVFELVRRVSPDTLIGPKKGDYCQSNGGRYSLYTNSGPVPNSSDTRWCTLPNATGEYFTPLESHGVTIQEGLTTTRDQQSQR